MPLLLLLLCALICPATELTDFDRPLASVNRTVITRGDVGERLQEMMWQLRRQGIAPPTHGEDIALLQQRALEQLIEEELLVQQADALEVFIDRRQLRREVIDQARQEGRADDMRAIAIAVEREERQAKIQQVLGFIESTGLHVGPEQIRRHYLAHKERFRRPGRLRLHQVSVLSSDPGDTERLTRLALQQGLVRSIRGHSVPAIRELVDDAFVDRVVEAAPAQQLRLLVDLCRRVLALPQIAEDAPSLLEPCRQLVEAAGGMRSAFAARATIELISDAVGGLEDPAARLTLLRHLARIYGEGPEAQEDGDLGWLQYDKLSRNQQLAIHGLPIGGLSAPIWTGRACSVILVEDIEAPRQRPLSEVSGEIESVLRKQCREELRENFLAKLAAEADVRHFDP